MPRVPGQDRPAEGRADEADRDREVLEVAEEPEHGLLPRLAVPFWIRDPVDGVDFDLAEQAALELVDGGLGGGLSSHDVLLASCDASHKLESPRVSC